MNVDLPPIHITHIEAGSGDPPVIFLHGVGLDAETFRGNLEAVAEGRRAVAWNMPGYGGSDLLDPLTISQCSAALAGLMRRLGIGRAVLAGHSFGGMVALDFLANHPEQVAGLVLIGTSPMFGSRDGSFEVVFLERLLGPLDAGRSMADLAPEVAAPMLGDDPACSGLAEAAFRRTPEAAYRVSVKAMLGFDRRALLASIAVPVLLVAGEKDRNVPLKTMQRMHEAIPGSRLEVLPGAGHLPHLERPERFDQLMRDFLS